VFLYRDRIYVLSTENKIKYPHPPKKELPVTSNEITFILRKLEYLKDIATAVLRYRFLLNRLREYEFSNLNRQQRNSIIDKLKIMDQLG